MKRRATHCWSDGGRTYCGQLSGNVWDRSTTDPAKVTCKACRKLAHLDNRRPLNAGCVA